MKSFEDLFSDLMFRGKMNPPRKKSKGVLKDENLNEEQAKALQQFLDGFKK